MAKPGSSRASEGGRSTPARAARDVARAERAAAQAAARRRRTLTTAVIAVVVVAVVGTIAGVVAYQRSHSGVNGAAPAGAVPAATSTSPGPTASADADQTSVGAQSRQSKSTAHGMGWGVGVGRTDAPVTLELFEDFSCPHCNELESSLGSQVATAVAAGTLRVIYYPMTLPGFGRPTELAANAFACAADAGKAEAYHDALYANFDQAAQQWSNSFLTDIGTSVGLGDDFGRCVRADRFAEWVRSVDDTGDRRGVLGTPTAFVDGTLVPSAQMSADGIMAEIAKAR
jgi:protein-disulfide isomerase